jgi:hypothetical protein
MKTPAEHIAGRYISPGARPEPYGQADAASDLQAVAAFIVWHHPRDLSGGIYADDAMLALGRLLDVPVAKLRKIVRGD